MDGKCYTNCRLCGLCKICAAFVTEKFKQEILYLCQGCIQIISLKLQGVKIN